MLNKNQVLASLHFVRRMRLFMRFLIKHQPLLCGRLTDYVIRYETQGRGSVHAHMLWWIDINPAYIHDDDVIKLDRRLMLRFGLAVEKSGRPDPNSVVDQFLGDVCPEPSPTPTASADPSPTVPCSAEAAESSAASTTDDDEDGASSDSSNGSASSPEAEPENADQGDDRPRRPRRKKLQLLFNPQFLSYTNANIWALKDAENLRRKLHIGLPPMETLSYVHIGICQKIVHKTDLQSRKLSGRRKSGTRRPTLP